MRVPYTQQFSPTSTPLSRTLELIGRHEGSRPGLQAALARAFFGTTTDPSGMAKNAVITLQAHGLIRADATLTEIGRELLSASSEAVALERLARHILLDLDAVQVVETLREMRQAAIPVNLRSLTSELRIRGVEAKDNSSDLSGVLGWLRAAGVLTGYVVNEDRYLEIVGSSTATIDALKRLTEAQVAFLRAMLALGVSDFTPYRTIGDHAEALYAGQVSYNWKDFERTILIPLQAEGFIELRKAPKATPGARGGKDTLVKPTEKFEKEVAEPLLDPIYRAAGFREVRRIRGIPLSTLVADVRQTVDRGRRAKALEMLAIRICQLLDLEFYGWRETDDALVAGGEVDAFLHAARLAYSRWQIQCKASDTITVDTIAKEVGMAEVTLASVILIVSTGRMTAAAQRFRDRIVSKSALNIAIVDGPTLDRIVESPAAITGILHAQAKEAMRLKPTPEHLTSKLPST